MKKSLFLVLLAVLLGEIRASYWNPTTFRRAQIGGLPVFYKEQLPRTEGPFFEDQAQPFVIEKSRTQDLPRFYYLAAPQLKKFGYTPTEIDPQLRAQQERQIGLFSPEGHDYYYGSSYQYQPFINQKAQYLGEQAQPRVSNWWQALKNRFNWNKQT